MLNTYYGQRGREDSVAHFVTAIRQLVDDGNYTNPEDMVRVHIMFTINSHGVRETLLSYGPELTLGKVIDIAHAHELSQRQLTAALYKELQDGGFIVRASQGAVSTPGQDMGEQLAVESVSKVTAGEITLTRAAGTLMGRTSCDRHTITLEKLFNGVPGGVGLLSCWTAEELITQLEQYDAMSVLIKEQRECGVEWGQNRSGSAITTVQPSTKGESGST